MALSIVSSSPFPSFFAFMPFTSPPAQNALPAPVKTMHLTSSFNSNSAIFSCRAPFISEDIAFLASGRFIVKYPTLFSILASRCSVPVSRFFICSSLVFYLLFYKDYEIKTVSICIQRKR